MRIIILGAGQVGSALAQILTNEGHDITIVDPDGERITELQEKYDLRGVVGCCSYPEILRQAGAEDADMVIAVSLSDEVNMVACQVAYSLFNIPAKIARIRSPHYLVRKDLFGKENLPIDVFISPEQLITHYVQQLITYPGTLQVIDFADGKVKLIALKPHYGGPLVGKTLEKLLEYKPHIKAKITAIFRGEKSIPLTKDTTVEVGDEVFFISASEDVPEIMQSLRRKQQRYKKILIAGGGSVGSSLAQALGKDYQVKLIDHNRERCRRLAEKLKHATVLYGDSRDEKLLIDENIETIDVFCAMTNDDETNIMACMQAKRLGVKRVMALITRTTYVDLIVGGPINIAISPQEATVSSILAHVRQGDIVSVHSLRRGSAEIIEAIAHGDRKTSEVVDRSIAEIKLPKGTTIGAIVRDGEVIIPIGKTQILSKDRVIMFVADSRKVRDVEKLFRVKATFF